MTVGMVSTKSLLRVTSDYFGTAAPNFFIDKAHKNEQLLMFAVQAICGLLSKIIKGSKLKTLIRLFKLRIRIGPWHTTKEIEL